MENMFIDKDVKIGEKVTFTKGIICTTYPLSDFKNYNGEQRCNNLYEGVVIDKTHKYALLPTVLVKNEDNVVCVRCY